MVMEGKPWIASGSPYLQWGRGVGGHCSLRRREWLERKLGPDPAW